MKKNERKKKSISPLKKKKKRRKRNKSIESEGHTTVGQRSCTKTDNKKKKGTTPGCIRVNVAYMNSFFLKKKMKMNLLKERERAI